VRGEGLLRVDSKGGGGPPENATRESVEKRELSKYSERKGFGPGMNTSKKCEDVLAEKASVLRRKATRRGSGLQPAPRADVRQVLRRWRNASSPKRCP